MYNLRQEELEFARAGKNTKKRGNGNGAPFEDTQHAAGQFAHGKILNRNSQTLPRSSKPSKRQLGEEDQGMENDPGLLNNRVLHNGSFKKESIKVPIVYIVVPVLVKQFCG